MLSWEKHIPGWGNTRGKGFEGLTCLADPRYRKQASVDGAQRDAVVGGDGRGLVSHRKGFCCPLSPCSPRAGSSQVQHAAPRARGKDGAQDEFGNDWWFFSGWLG